MRKINKTQQVLDCLSQWMNDGSVNKRQLAHLHYKDLIDDPEFKDISGRTIEKALKTFKEHHLPKGLLKVRVREFLDRMMASGELDAEQLEHLKAVDLIRRKELSGIGKTTITGALREYKSRSHRNPSDAKQVITETKEPTQKKRSMRPVFQKDSAEFGQQDVEILKTLLERYQTKNVRFFNVAQSELNTIKSALAYAGINAEVIMERYAEVKGTHRKNRKGTYRENRLK
jgi:hypothetical protein